MILIATVAVDADIGTSVAILVLPDLLVTLVSNCYCCYCYYCICCWELGLRGQGCGVVF